MRYDGLTRTQRDVARFVGEGLTNAAIATELGIHEQTVRFHVWRIGRVWKLDAKKNVRVQIANRVRKPAA